MKIAAIQHFSMLDYPGKMSAIIFTQGCPLRCSYCHNAELQTISPGTIPFSDVISFLKSRVGLLEGIVFCGGEPLFQPDLYEAMVQIKKLGFAVGLHTSGYIYERFCEILPVVDWVGFDIKTTFKNYEKITGVSNSGNIAEKSFIKMLKHRSNLDFEIRTTVDSRYISFDDLLEIAHFLKDNNVKEWVLQQCVLRYEDKDDVALSLPNNAELEKLKKVINIKVRS